MSDILITARGLHFRRDGRNILNDVSLTVHRGESVALTGPSGSGKTALLALLAGLERPDAGTLNIAASPSETSLIVQGFGLIGLLTAEENVAMPLLTRGRTVLSPTDVQARVREALDAVGLRDHNNALVETLSGGQQQRVSIARAIITRPTLLLADEPSSALDRESRERVLRALRALHHAGTTVIVATHDHEVARAFQRIVRVTDGTIAADTESSTER